MNDQAIVAKSGAWVSFAKQLPSGMYEVKLYGANGDLMDKVRCDSYSEACAYKKSFIKIARNS